VSSSDIGISSYKIRYLYVLSANSEKSVKSQMQSLGIYLEQRPETLELSLMGKVAYTLCQRRSFLTWKVAVSAQTSAELVRKLSNPDLRPLSSFYAPKISFVFTGQGAQWHAMGRELMKGYPIFASAIEAADKCLKSLGASWSLLGTKSPRTAAHFLTSNRGIIQRCEVVQY
jgi:acyl transferase domain-containing protein